MGFLDKLVSLFGIKKKECRVVVVGLDNSGKTTILNHFKPTEAKDTLIVPTIGFAVEQFKYKNVVFSAWDMSGQSRYRNLWEQYYRDCQGIIFVIDSADSLRLVVAKDELDMLLEHENIQARHIPILLFANKMDLKDAMSPLEISRSLELSKLQLTDMAPIEEATLRPIVYYEFLQGQSARAAADISAAFKGNVVHYSTVSR
ncbi:unnamed protein product [Darwinula stevensoni]|uniref:ADP-ribosylation factor-like protein 6 n=1 Tax=Darwinula stevensoni TaxID=69355 RepID=A0A7R9AB78_9CRUS|nr:unnamed protein product [Darwinula stevensoni]CAG0899108.1 unnamed protein product [Darwinula stevensoni]